MTPIKLSKVEKIVLFISLSLATFMMVLDYSIANVSIPYIAGDLSVSVDEGTYVITSFAVGNAIGLAMTGWLTKRIGLVRLLTVSLALFTLFSWICGASVSLQMLVISRFIQGFVSGPMIPLSQSMILNTGTPESRSRDLSIWSTIIITAPVLGPILGGYISEWHTWSGIFYINIPVGIFCTMAIWMIMHNNESVREKAPADIPGFVLLTIGVSALQILLDKGEQWDWLNSNTIRILMITTVISFTLLVIRELFHNKPFLELRLFSIPLFSLSIVCLSISYAIYFGSIVLVPLWLQEYMNYDAVWAGLSVSTIGIAPFLLSMITPRIVKTIGNLSTLMVSFMIFTGACFYNAYFTSQVDVSHIAFARFLFGFGMIIYINPLISMSVEKIPAEKLPSATGIFHFFRAMVGGVGTSVFTTLWERRTIFHHERLGETLTPFNPLVPPPLDEQGLALLNTALDQQASLLALNDAFFLMAWLFIGLVLLLAFWRFREKKPTSTNIHDLPIAAE
ncbi:MAG: DHA2 family efflux MFS transporter permease subunit [Simkania sp.]|nr:DHA2 family efflux MFS transporter permease subunit [Simkania sp.]